MGVLLCRAGQSTEEEMYNNEEASPAFSAFLELLGEQVLLKGFNKYAAQLDTKSERLFHFTVTSVHVLVFKEIHGEQNKLRNAVYLI